MIIFSSHFTHPVQYQIQSDSLHEVIINTDKSRNSSDIRTNRLLDYMEYSSQFGSIPGVHKFSKNLEATSQFQAPDW